MPEPSEPVQAPPTAAEREARRRRLAEVFGDVLPEQTRDDSAEPAASAGVPCEGSRAGSSTSSITSSSSSETRSSSSIGMADSESWRKFVWYDAVQALAPGHGTTLVRASERSFALVFPRAP